MKPEHAMVEYIPAIDRLIAHYNGTKLLDSLDSCPLCMTMEELTKNTEHEYTSSCRRGVFTCPWIIHSDDTCFRAGVEFSNFENGDTAKDRIERLERWKWDILKSHRPVEVSFWYHWRRRQRKIKLNKSNRYRVELSHSAPHDEGYSYESVNFTLRLTLDGWIVEQIAETGGKDCDGEISYTYEKFALVSELSAGNPMPKKWDDKKSEWIWDEVKMQPKWSESTCRVYDQYAQLAGY